MWDRNRQLLDGEWQYSLPGDEEHAVPREVPGSYRCVGDSVYSRRFVWNGGEGRWDLCFEGIAYEGTVFLNGIRLGTMEPYSSYRFDVTAVLCAGENRLEVSLQDITAVFGPSLGWRNYSGIIRSVFLEQKPAILTYSFTIPSPKPIMRPAASWMCAPGESTERRKRGWKRPSPWRGKRSPRPRFPLRRQPR